MLSRTFMTARQLKISEGCYNALVEVYFLLSEKAIPAHLFDMNVVGSPKLLEKKNFCGTAGCLLGWARAVDKAAMACGWPYSSELRALFFPDHCSAYHANRTQATRALFSYLSTGKDNWAEVMCSTKEERNVLRQAD